MNMNMKIIMMIVIMIRREKNTFKMFLTYIGSLGILIGKSKYDITKFLHISHSNKLMEKGGVANFYISLN
jgi:hypothetical protein